MYSYVPRNVNNPNVHQQTDGMKKMLYIYWVGQKGCLDFFITAYDKTRMNSLANPIYTMEYYSTIKK